MAVPPGSAEGSEALAEKAEAPPEETEGFQVPCCCCSRDAWSAWRALWNASAAPVPGPEVAVV
jgi:hypothetical protein